VSKRRLRRQRRRNQQVKKRPHGKQGSVLVLEYYSRAFQLLHEELTRSGCTSSEVHPIRRRFWQFIPPGEYDLQTGRSYLQTYLRTLESEMQQTISKSSLAYWLHLYRRLSPGYVGEDNRPATIALTRAILEIAIQKYARFDLCDRVCGSKDVPIDKVLGGLLMAPMFERERRLLSATGNQLVLSQFTCAHLVEFYGIEKLAYETYQAAATLRSIGKGALLVVKDNPAGFITARTDDLTDALQYYDARQQNFHVSATGVVFDSLSEGTAAGHIPLPMYNVDHVTSESLKDLFAKALETEFTAPIVLNFLWGRFNVRRFRTAHLPLSEAFRGKYGVSLDAVLAVIASLCARVVTLWAKKEPKALVHHWQRAYDGPAMRKEVRSGIAHFLPVALDILGMGNSTITNEELDCAIAFWELTAADRDQSDLAYSGPHQVFLPCGKERWLIDYAWIHRRLYDLFLGVSISDQNFKGAALETAVGHESSVLPQRRCKALDGTEKQIDCAYSVGDHLVVIECKAVGRSIGYERGDPEAILYRHENVVERGLKEADEKAAWIAERPRGKNYDITRFRDVLPIAVSPFVEFIPNKSSRYWISSGVARVLTPEELTNVLKDPTILENAMNRVPVKRG
jgi:hypothetical protein